MGAAEEAVAVLGEIRRLKELDESSGRGVFAVLARTRKALEPIRALLEHEGVPRSHYVDRTKAPPLHRVRGESVFSREAPWAETDAIAHERTAGRRVIGTLTRSSWSTFEKLPLHPAEHAGVLGKGFGAGAQNSPTTRSRLV